MNQVEESLGQDVPEHWTIIPVDQAGEVRVGRSRSPDRVSGPHQTPYLRAANITPDGIDVSELLTMEFTPAERDTYALLDGDIVLTEASGSSSHVGRSAIWRNEIELCCFQNTVIRFRPNLVSSQYAHIVFQHFSASGFFGRVARGVGIQHLSGRRFAKMPFPLPPRQEQDRIAEEASRRLSDLNGASARLTSALDRLDELTRVTIETAVQGELVPISRDRFEDSETNTAQEGSPPSPEEFNAGGRSWPMPEGWRLATVEQAGEARLGRQRAPRYDTGPNMRPYLRVANVFEDRIDTTDVLEMNFDTDEVDVYELLEGDILLNEGQSPELVGRPAIYRGEVPGSCFQNTLIRFRVGEGVESEFALLVFRYYLHSGIFRSIAKWSTNIAHLGLSRFRALPFPLPPVEQQRKIVDEVRGRISSINHQSASVRRALDRLPEARKEVLQAAVSGGLVSRNSNEGDAIDLVAEYAATTVKRASKRTKSTPKKPESDKRITALSDTRPQPEPSPNLHGLIRDAGGAMTTAELFRAAKYNPNDPEHVELFYRTIQACLGETIEADNIHSEDAVIRVRYET